MHRAPSLARSMSEVSDISSREEQRDNGLKMNHAGNEGEGMAPDEEKEADFITGVWGVIYTVSREKQVPMAQVVFKLVLDCWQLLLLIINPMYGWNINGESAWWYVLSFVGLANFFRDRGLTFFLVCLYVFVFLLMMTAALCVWVAYSFKSNKFDYVWPITFLRWFSNIFFQMLDIASMTLFLIPMDCQYTASSPDIRYHNQEFPAVQCWTMPFLIHVVVSALSVLVFMLMATAFQMGDMETDPTTRNPLAMGHSKVEVIGFLTKFWLTACSVFITNLKWLSICYILGCILLVYLYITWVPHYVAWVNHVRCASYGAVLYSAVVMAVMVWQTGVDPLDHDAISQWNNSCTIALLAGIIPAAMLAAGASSWRLRWLLGTVVNKFRFAAPQLDLQLIHKFRDPREVEVCIRSVRKWMLSETGAEVLDPLAMDLAETIVKVGIVQFKGQAYMHILYASFLVDVRKSLQSSLMQLSQAKKSQPSFLERFAIFSREQQQVQSDNNGSDLLSYVQMQRNFRLATKVYREALMAMSEFWNCVLRHEVEFDALLRCVKVVDSMVTNADTVYKDMLSNTIDNWRILRVYAKYLEVIKCDPWGAAERGKEADDMFRAEEEGQQNVFTGATRFNQSDERSARIKAAFEDHRCALVINAFGAITMANKAAFTLFGCKTADLIGQNIKILMPNPFRDHHDTFLKNYLDTGRPKILGKTTEVVAQHFDGHLFAVNLIVTKLSGSGMDSTFLGMMRAMPDTGIARVWALSDGSVLSVENSIVNWFGYTTQEMCGGSFLRFVKELKVQEEILRMSRECLAARVASYEAHGNRQRRSSMCADVVEETQEPEWHVDAVLISHKFLEEPVSCNICITAGGSDTQHFLIYAIKRMSTAQPVMVTDSAGRVRHVCDSTAESLGTSVKQIMAQGNLLALIPEAISQLHSSLLLKNSETVSVPPHSCRSGLSVMLNVTTPRGTQMQPFHVKLKRKVEDDGSTLHVVSMHKRTMQQALSERCLAVLVDMQGMVQHVSSPDAKLFGFAPSDLIGSYAGSFLDIMADSPGPRVSASNLRLEEENSLAFVMKALISRCVDKPGCSFRVGVLPPAANSDLDSFSAEIAARMRTSGKKAAVMKVVLHCINKNVARLREVGEQTAAAESMFNIDAMGDELAAVKGDFMVELQLWKADCITGMLRLNEKGLITDTGSSALYPGGLAFGSSEESMLHKHISAYLPLSGRPITDLLEPMDAKQATSRRGGMKAPKDLLQSRKQPGVINTLQTTHQTDGRELMLQVQAVASRGHRPSITLIVHVHQPQVGMPHFKHWLLGHGKMPMGVVGAPAGPGSMRGGSPLVPHTPSGRSTRAPSRELSKASLYVPDAHRSLEEGMLSMSMKKKKRLIFNNADAGILPEQLEEACLEGIGQLDLPEAEQVCQDSSQQVQALVPGDAKQPSLEGLLQDLMDGNAAESAEADAEGQTAAQLQPQTSKRDRIRAWVQEEQDDATAAPRNAAGWNSSGSSEELSGRLSDAPAQLGMQEDPWVPSDAKQRLDEPAKEDQFSDLDATASMASETVDAPQPAALGASEYKRARRYKRLSRLLTGSAAAHMLNAFFYKAAGTAAFVVAVTIACFVVALNFVGGLEATVQNIQQTGFAANALANIAVEVNYLLMLNTNHTLPWLQGLQSPGDASVHLERLLKFTETFRDLHEQIYTLMQNIPSGNSGAAEALQQLWSKPTVTVYFPGSVPDTRNVTLWEAGQSIVNKALVVWQQTPGFPAGVANATTYDAWPDVSFILNNTRDTLLTAYTDCMNQYLQVVLSIADNFNTIHYYFLAIEGCVCCVIALLVMLVITTQVLVYRWSILGIFVLLPTAVIRGLASRVVMLLGDGSVEEPAAVEGEGQEETSLEATEQKHATPWSGDGVRGSTVNITDKATFQDTSALGILRSTLASLRFWHWRAQVHAAPSHSKRTLVRSKRMVVWFMLPFAIWGAMMIIINAVAHSQLDMVDGKVALFNLVNYNIAQCNRFHIFLQTLSVESDPVKLQAQHAYLEARVPVLFSDYNTMLYGIEAANTTATSLSPSSSHLTEGLVHTTFGRHILLQVRECLRANQSSCLQPGHRLYSYTRRGLDALYNRYFEVLRANLSSGALTLASPEFDYLDQTRPDMEGGLLQLCNQYYDHVLSVYQGVLRTHIIGLVLTLLLMMGFGFFMLWPFVVSCRTEGKRIADLLSQLPPEINVETLVRRALLMGSGAASMGGAQPSEIKRMASKRERTSEPGAIQRRSDSHMVDAKESSVFRPSRSVKGV